MTKQTRPGEIGAERAGEDRNPPISSGVRYQITNRLPCSAHSPSPHSSLSAPPFRCETLALLPPVTSAALARARAPIETMPRDLAIAICGDSHNSRIGDRTIVDTVVTFTPGQQ